MILSINDGDLAVKIDTLGGELHSVKKGETEFLWQGDSTYWGKRAPLLFPIVGRLRANTINIRGKKREITPHGFLRDTQGEIVKQTDSEVELHFTFSEETLQKYPFKCDVTAIFKIEGGKFKTQYTVRNLDTEKMVYNFGLHPAFNCNTNEGELFEDYYLEFDKNLTLKTCDFNNNDEMEKDNKYTVINNSNKMSLKHNMFHRTLVFTDLNFDTVYLCHKERGKLLKFSFENFNIFAMWQPVNAPFLCFEPWCGMSSIVQDFDNFEDSPFAQFLSAGSEKTFKMEISF